MSIGDWRISYQDTGKIRVSIRQEKDNLFILITLGKQKMFACEKKITANINFQNGNANYETELEKLLRTSFKAKCRICVLHIQWKDTIY